MSFVVAVPEALAAAASDVANIGSALSAANAAAAAGTTGLLAAGADEVSAALASLFSGHAVSYQQVAAQATALHDQFVQALTGAGGSYALTEAANVQQNLLNAINAPTQALLGRPLIGDGAVGTASSPDGQDGGLLFGNGGATRCESDDILAGNDDPKLPLVTCSTDHKTAYLLAPSIISGDQIQNATSGMDQRGIGYVVDLQFKGPAANIWADYTAAHIGTQTAFTLDSQVVSAPQIQEAIPGGRTQISGGDPPFTAATARQLANVLKYGSLPLSFEPSEAQTVSATLGLSSLRAGMIAGAIGLLLVLVYSLLYYRVLGLLTALSLVASGSMVFAILVLLGRYINYTLDLAGIAGLIIGIGTTADSFVVFFERIKDEIREGRSFRSAVPRGWARARKTIVSGNAVTFLAAAVLYFLAIGQVKGFAFTLGLTTILDLVVVFLVTWPLVYLASKSSLLAKPAYNGLGAVQQVARERRAMARTGRG